MKLKLDFYQRDGVNVAQDLLGKLLVRELDGQKIISKIVETEAYIGPEDKACHAYQNKRTKRTEVMFGRAGNAYIYLIYGMYNCLNIVTASVGKPEAVLIRAVEPIEGLDTIRKYRQIKSKKVEDLTNGPGKLCQALAIDKKLNGYDMTYGDKLYVLDSNYKLEVVKDKRINIDYAEEYKEKLWRFYIKGNPFVSR
ncbi:3-methyladenine DNA glycosylase [Orenia metallireducens]|uniref:Putative 3-methyladenine DNA glycosylase n=1 Tax=Orenia metallireducens TaxID=1413210 RepID=A0A1C0A562_9FIRM|nr:DNA-3-methyladenine glycosylase [Orenia metallireducens]OCL25253.1 3-methyladenine DNA glycosylase [Orenia metallireducens]